MKRETHTCFDRRLVLVLHRQTPSLQTQNLKKKKGVINFLLNLFIPRQKRVLASIASSTPFSLDIGIDRGNSWVTTGHQKSSTFH